MFELTIAPFTLITWFILGIQIGQSFFGDSSHPNFLKIQGTLCFIVITMSSYNLWLSFS